MFPLTAPNLMNPKSQKVLQWRRPLWVCKTLISHTHIHCISSRDGGRPVCASPCNIQFKFSNLLHVTEKSQPGEMVITKEMEEEEKHLVEEGEKKEREMMEEVNHYINNIYDMIPASVVTHK